MNKSLYHKARSAFVDRVVVKDFIRLQTNVGALEKLKSIYDRPFKIVVLYGEPGVGKTHLLKQLMNEKKGIVALFQPPMELQKFQEKLSFLLKRDDLFMHKPKKPYTMVIDEAQLLSNEQLELIRLLSDTGNYRFILAIHHMSPDQLLSHQHFSTRIFTTIQLLPPSRTDLEIYIKQKLFFYDALDLSNAFDKKTIKRIHTYTKGNLRKTNRFLFTLFDMLCYFERERPLVLQRHSMKEFVEMAALHLGYENA